MPSALVLSSSARDASADAVARLLDGGSLRLFTAAEGGALLAECRFADPAFGPAVGGVATAHPMAPEPYAKATGRARWFQAVRGGGDVVLEGPISTQAGDAPVTLADPELRLGDEVVVDRVIYTQPNA